MAVRILALLLFPLAGLLSLPSAALAGCGDGGPAGLGPLALRSQSPGQILRLTPVPRDAEVLASGEYEAQFMSSVTSIYAKDTRYHLDMHLADVRLGVAMGLGDCWDLELAFDQRAIVDAGLDDITLAFHRMFGFDNSGQDDEPRNTTEIDFPGYGIHMDDSDRGVFSRAGELTLTRLLRTRDAAGPALGVSAQMRYESIGRDEFEQEDTDVGLGLTLDYPVGDDHVYANINHVWFGIDHFMGLPMAKRQFTGMLAREWRRGDDFSWIVQYLYTEGVMLHLGGLSEPAHEVHLGFKRKWNSATVEAALIENIVTYNNSPDFGFALGVKAPF